MVMSKYHNVVDFIWYALPPKASLSIAEEIVWSSIRNSIIPFGVMKNKLLSIRHILLILAHSVSYAIIARVVPCTPYPSRMIEKLRILWRFGEAANIVIFAAH